MKKRVFAVLMAAVLLLGLLPAQAKAEDVWIDNTVDTSVGHIEVSLIAENKQSNRLVRYEIYSAEASAVFDGKVTDEVLTAINEGVSLAEAKIAQEGFTNVTRINTTSSSETFWDNRKYETSGTNDDVHIASGDYGRDHYYYVFFEAETDRTIYSCDVDRTGKGNVKVSPMSAFPGTDITVSLSALPGYAISSVGVFGPSGQISAIVYGYSGVTDDAINFKMPEGDVNISAGFIRMPRQAAMQAVFGGADQVRSSGKSRYDTAIATADNLKKAMGIDKFDTIIIASGSGSGVTGKFPDALSGSYLAARYSAPILLVGSDGTGLEQAAAYIRENLNFDSEGPEVIILGGSSAVPESVEEALKGIYTDRLSGKDRFVTNYLVLEHAGIDDGDDLLVADGRNFADALSASALGKPILLIDKNSGKLTVEQEDIILGRHYSNIYILGGTGSVPESIETAIKGLANGTNVERLKGKNRYDTSIEVAKKFYSAAECVTLATGVNFPDGLTGGPLAYALGAPMVLVNKVPSDYAKAAAYAREANVRKFLVFGGTGAMPEEVVSAIMAK